MVLAGDLLEDARHLGAKGDAEPTQVRADYDPGWNVVETDVDNAITLARHTFVRWRAIHGESVARHHFLSMFRARR
ncbi:MAG: hypothetical protein ACRD9L_22090 [Bryobacteraceae bacterium]